MVLMNSFDDFMFYKLLAGLLHTNIEDVYWSLSIAGIIALVIIYCVYYFTIKFHRNRW